MGSLLIPNAQYYAPNFSIRTPGVDHWGFSPIPITIDALGCTYGSHHPPYSPSQAPNFVLSTTFQLWINDVDVDAPITIADKSLQFALLTPVAIPAVDGTNVDGAARFTVRSPATTNFDDWAYAVIRYTPTSAADVGKCILGLGAANFATASQVGKFSALVPPGTFPAWWGGGTTPFFATYEDAKPVGNAVPPAGHVWPVTGTFQDFKLVARAGGGPGGLYKIALRINKTDAMTITTAATATRIWTPDGGVTSVPIAAGDLVDWKLVTAPATLDADVLFTFRASGLGLGRSGYGEGGYGEGGYGGT